MKNLTKIAIVLMILSGSVFNASGQTLKERIDNAKEIKVYFDYFPIHHDTKTVNINGVSISTGCTKFTETTPFTTEYTDVEKQVIDLLNTGFKTTVFIKGDIKTVPLMTGILPEELKYEQLIREYPGQYVYDFIKLGQPLLFYFLISGGYTVENRNYTSDESTKRDLVNSLSIWSYLSVYCSEEGKKDIVPLRLSANLIKNYGYASTRSYPTKVCNDFAWFVKYFAIPPLAEPFKTTFVTNITDFTEKEMAKYDKAMKKKK